ncbi:hypothetical protein [Flavimaricola marinus]|uniref:hypothetical protein n=1 Tax=Flavimaricola marinus TaxID=1819565 RepID=UPI000B8ABE58|nr:hypothetical protein [Flavimaricola marinus]
MSAATFLIQIGIAILLILGGLVPTIRSRSRRRRQRTADPAKATVVSTAATPPAKRPHRATFGAARARTAKHDD